MTDKRLEQANKIKSIIEQIERYIYVSTLVKKDDDFMGIEINADVWTGEKSVNVHAHIGRDEVIRKMVQEQVKTLKVFLQEYKQAYENLWKEE